MEPRSGPDRQHRRPAHLAADNRGDVVLLEDDPLGAVGDSAAVAEHLRDMRVAATFFAGRATHLLI